VSVVFHYGDSIFRPMPGAPMDRFGPQEVLPLGAFRVSPGLLFASASVEGEVLQGVGAAAFDRRSAETNHSAG